MKTYKLNGKTYKVVDVVFGAELPTYERLCEEHYIPSMDELKLWCENSKDQVLALLQDCGANDITSSTHYTKNIDGEDILYIEGISQYEGDLLYTAEHELDYGVSPVVCFEEIGKVKVK
jgi:hypothetical protein